VSGSGDNPWRPPDGSGEERSGVPPYPPPGYPRGWGGPPVRRPGLALGIALSSGAQLAVALVVLGLALGGSGVDLTWAPFASLAVVVTGIVLVVVRRQDRVGEGMIIGWAIGLVLVPLVLFGLCVQALSGQPL
jgi:hypothetical protein